MDINNLRGELYEALQAARDASDALLRAVDLHGRASPEAAAAHEHLRQAQEVLMECQRAYLEQFRGSGTTPPAR